MPPASDRPRTSSAHGADNLIYCPSATVEFMDSETLMLARHYKSR